MEARQQMTRDNSELISRMYQSHFNDVKHYFCLYFKDEMRAEDMTQDLFIKLMSYENMIVEATAKSFIFTMAKRMVIDEGRHQQFVRLATAGYKLKMEENRFWQDSETLECKQIREMELAKLRTLPQRMAQVYRLTRFEEKSAQELADELHISKRTVEYHLLVSRKEIRSALKKAINM
ncbi:MAG: sigma-70 family RNA polymerase sigma factor [Prevotella sp.]|nr:sigma-70 family RNA polymerase sigma factor [Prevotella sp.]